jgi:hypothetical protein
MSKNNTDKKRGFLRTALKTGNVSHLQAALAGEDPAEAAKRRADFRRQFPDYSLDNLLPTEKEMYAHLIEDVNKDNRTGYKNLPDRELLLFIVLMHKSRQSSVYVRLFNQMDVTAFTEEQVRFLTQRINSKGCWPGPSDVAEHKRLFNIDLPCDKETISYS